MRTSAAMRQNAQRGYFNGSNAPFGFAVEQVELARGRTKQRLVSNSTEADVVRFVFQLYVAGNGAKNVARDMNSRGLRFRGRPWNRDKVLGVIGETAAIGTYYWGKSDTRNGTVRDKDEWILMTVEPKVGVAVAVALVLGKPLGIVAVSLLTVRARLSVLPEGFNVRHLVVLGTVAGIGFTMSLFVARLAFEEAALLGAAKLGVLAASAVAMIFGLLIGRVVLPIPREKPEQAFDRKR